MASAVIVGAARTPNGKAGGGLAKLSAVELGAIAIREAVERCGIDRDLIQKVIMGYVYSAGLGQAPHRQASLKAGLPCTIPTKHAEAVCSSGLQAVFDAALDITSPYGGANILVAGGMESMTHAKFTLPEYTGKRILGKTTLLTWALAAGVLTKEHLDKLEHIKSLNEKEALELIKSLSKKETLALIKEFVQSLDALVELPLYDTLVQDGLLDPYSDKHMGECAELCVARYGFTREQLDDFGYESHRRAREAEAKGFLNEEIVPVQISDGLHVARDEGPWEQERPYWAERRPAFGGLLTAGTSAQLSDGGAAVVVANEELAANLALPILARILSFATYAHNPQWYTTAPIYAARKALRAAGLNANDIDFWECNEAFAPVPMALAQDLCLPWEKLNICGGAIARGHPIGATGAVLLVRLVHDLRRLGKRYGLVAVCNGGGEARAMIVENPNA